MMKKVYICAPLGGDVKGNLEKAKQYTEYALKCGTAPVVPHFYAFCLDDSIPSEHNIGRKAGMSLLWFCDEMWIFGDAITERMTAEIEFCRNLNLKIRKIRESEILESFRRQMLMRKKTMNIFVCICLTVILCACLSVTAFAAGDVAGAIENTWTTAQEQIKTVVNKVVFPVVDMILAILLFVKIGTAYMDYRKHGQFEFTAPAILFACLIFTLTAPLYIWTNFAMNCNRR